MLGSSCAAGPLGLGVHGILPEMPPYCYATGTRGSQSDPISSSTRPAWETLPAAKLPPAWPEKSQEHTSLPTTSRWRTHGGGNNYEDLLFILFKARSADLCVRPGDIKLDASKKLITSLKIESCENPFKEIPTGKHFEYFDSQVVLSIQKLSLAFNLEEINLSEKLIFKFNSKFKATFRIIEYLFFLVICRFEELISRK